MFLHLFLFGFRPSWHYRWYITHWFLKHILVTIKIWIILFWKRALYSFSHKPYLIVSGKYGSWFTHGQFGTHYTATLSHSSPYRILTYRTLSPPHLPYPISLVQSCAPVGSGRRERAPAIYYLKFNNNNIFIVPIKRFLPPSPVNYSTLHIWVSKLLHSSALSSVVQWSSSSSLLFQIILPYLINILLIADSQHENVNLRFECGEETQTLLRDVVGRPHSPRQRRLRKQRDRTVSGENGEVIFDLSKGTAPFFYVNGNCEQKSAIIENLQKEKGHNHKKFTHGIKQISYL